jgi:tetratricopeptide (TPR) repeat protein
VFSPHWPLVAIGGSESLLELWDIERQQRVRTFPVEDDDVVGLVFSHDGQQIISAGDRRSLVIWDVQTGDVVKRLEGHTRAVISLDISPSGEYLLTASEDATMRLWHFESGIQLDSLAYESPVTCVRFAPNGETALSGTDDGVIRLWSLGLGWNAQTCFGRAILCRREGDFARAIELYEQALELDPSLPMAYNNLSWELVTCPVENLREPRRAIELGTKACELTEWHKASCIDTLAAAYAACGEFERAIELQKKAIEIIDDERASNSKGCLTRLEQYRNREAFVRIQ